MIHTEKKDYCHKSYKATLKLWKNLLIERQTSFDMLKIMREQGYEALQAVADGKNVNTVEIWK